MVGDLSVVLEEALKARVGNEGLLQLTYLCNSFDSLFVKHLEHQSEKPTACSMSLLLLHQKKKI
jgi:hypothetical protein